VTSLSSSVAIGLQASKLGMHLADPNTTRYVTLPARSPARAHRP
jgi:hypothetical protein